MVYVNPFAMMTVFLRGRAFQRRPGGVAQDNAGRPCQSFRCLSSFQAALGFYGRCRYLLVEHGSLMLQRVPCVHVNLSLPQEHIALWLALPMILEGHVPSGFFLFHHSAPPPDETVPWSRVDCFPHSDDPNRNKPGRDPTSLGLLHGQQNTGDV